MSEFKEHLDNDLVQGLLLSTSARSKEMDLKIIMGPLQLEMICGALTLLKGCIADVMARRVRSSHREKFIKNIITSCHQLWN